MSAPLFSTPGGMAGEPGTNPTAADPWGVRRAEQLLASLEGVLSARIVTSPLGEVSEVHVLAQSGLTPKQLVRNVESALLAHLGLKVDHRKISVAQTADVRPIAALQQEVVRDTTLRRVLLFEDLQVLPAARPHRLQVRVQLSFRGQSAAGEAEAPDTERGRMDAAASAALEAIGRLFRLENMVLEGTRRLEAFDREWVMVGVQELGVRTRSVVTGTAEVRESLERAAAYALLDATNRWTNFRRPE